MGRPRQFDEPASETIRVRVTPEQRTDLEQVARENNTNLADAIRQAVNDYVADYRDGHPVFRSPKPSR
jgi:predicted DNA-binding ribbon-helix-helix protein